MSTLGRPADGTRRPMDRRVGRGASPRARWGLWVRQQAPLIGPLVALLLMVALFSALAPDTFLTPDNLTNLLSQVSVLAVMATGLTFVLLLGEIDLGFASVAVLAGISASLFHAGERVGLPVVGAVSIGQGSQLLSILLPLLIALALGMLAGTLTARLGVPSFITTLGVLLLAEGWSFYWSQGKNVFNDVPLAATLGGSSLGPVPLIVLSAAVVLLAAHVTLSRTRFGRYVYMTGANRDAARLSGIPTRRVIIQVFALSAVLAALAGLLNIGRLGSSQANAGSQLLLPTIAAVVLGGTSLFGGVGGITNTVIGLLLYGVLDNGLDQLNFNIYLKPFARGVFLLAAIVFNIIGLQLASRAKAEIALEAEDQRTEKSLAEPATS